MKSQKTSTPAVNKWVEEGRTKKERMTLLSLLGISRYCLTGKLQKSEWGGIVHIQSRVLVLPGA
jgi:hypothetical protein